jgi:N-acetylglutamate synthase-like GNAT family acetyltransferase
LKRFFYQSSRLEEFISNNPTYIVEENENIVGFYGVILAEKETCLEYFFIKPKSIGKGYGKILWNHMVNTCKELGINEFAIVTSPQAKKIIQKWGLYKLEK